MQVKTMIIMIIMIIIKKSTNNKCWIEYGKKGNSPTLLAGIKIGATLENNMVVP